MSGVNGVLCIDKPQGVTSFDVVATIRRLLHERKAGHAGTLDPMATGVLPVFLGEATKAISLLPDHDKRYVASLRLGVTTDTGDITGKVLTKNPAGVSEEDVKAAVMKFGGEIMQVPPMYSALKSGGRHLYDIAREGGVVEREPRPVTIREIGVSGRDVNGDYIISVFCSKGTYIRTLCEDIGAALGCGGAMSSLRRTYAVGFDISRCITLNEAKALNEENKLLDYILSVDELFAKTPEVCVTVSQAVRFRNGGALSFDRLEGVPESGICRVKCGGLIIGLGIADRKARELKVRCHFNRDAEL